MIEGSGCVPTLPTTRDGNGYTNLGKKLLEAYEFVTAAIVLPLGSVEEENITR